GVARSHPGAAVRIGQSVFSQDDIMYKIPLLAIALVSVTASAQTPVASDTITFDQAIGIALRQNSVLRQSENAAALSTTVVTSRKQQFLPTLQLSTNTAQTLGRTFSQSEGRIIDQ